MVEAQILSNRRSPKKWIDFTYGSNLDLRRHVEPLTFTRKEQDQIRKSVEKMNYYSLRSAKLRRAKNTAQVRRVNVKAWNTLLKNGTHLFRILRGVTDIHVSTFADLFGDEAELTLTLDEKTRRFPWELAYDGNAFLCQSYDVGRKVLHRRVQRESGKPPLHPAALVIGLNYKGRRKRHQLRTAEREALQVKKLIKKRHYSVRLLLGKKATVREARRILSRGVSVFHFTGHGAYKKHQPSGRRGSLELKDGELTKEDLRKCFERAGGAPFLSFLNACQSAEEIYSSPIMDAFIEEGAECVIGTFWAVYEPPSTKFSLAFYREVANDETFARALRLARKQFVGKRGFSELATWPSFVFYGSPSARLTAPKRP